jgi:hypothetical protein
MRKFITVHNTAEALFVEALACWWDLARSSKCFIRTAGKIREMSERDFITRCILI